MKMTFGDQLKQFALSIDIVNELNLSSITKLIEQYVKDTLNINSVKILLSTTIDGEPALKRYSLGTYEEETVTQIKKAGKYNGQTSLAFDRGKPLWIIAASGKQQLTNCKTYRDLWSGSKAIPRYKPIVDTKDPLDSDIRTSIIIPIFQDGQVIGVLDFETSEYLEYTEEAKQELTKIAETVGILLKLYRASEERRFGTGAALDNLRELLNKPLPKLTKPNIFLASSSRGEQDVIDVIKEVLQEYESQLSLIFWADMNEPGNINQHLLEAIAKCRYGICYLSERVSDNEYKDNVNVVFEAGMFHGRLDEITDAPTSWIPIRERQSPELPFDFAQERILWVDRNRDGSLKKQVLAGSLRKSLNEMLSSD